ncbi:Uncharacterised protein [Peptoniphilus harei]|uniref:Uncharacterized protein n=1 Tax=Peptoniphilus harei TaxID=54005 RepID=A0A2X1XD93_9FIRM|nr:Uncharacterised protein [Peptoniphilus harei]
MKNDGQKAVRLPSFFEAILPILTMVALMVYVFKFSDEAYDAAHMPLNHSTYSYCYYWCNLRT